MARHRLSSSPFFPSLALAIVVAAGACAPATAPGASGAPEPCGAPATALHEVQGSGPRSPLAGNEVSVEAVVVGVHPGLRGLYLQEEDADADRDPASSEGIFVFDPRGVAATLRPGDLARVAGRVEEFGDQTQIAATAATRCASGRQAAATAASVVLPLAAPEDWERWEGMRVAFAEDLFVADTRGLGRYGEAVLVPGGPPFQLTERAAPSVEAAAAEAARFARASIVLDDGDAGQNPDPTPHLFDDGRGPTLRRGDRWSRPLAIVSEGFGSYRLQPAEPPRFERESPRPVSAPDVGPAAVRIATVNLLNLFDGDGNGGGFPTARGATDPAELARQLAKSVAAIRLLDAHVIALQELENDDDAPDDARSSAAETLVAALNEAEGSAAWSWIPTGPIGPQVIRVGLLYRPEVVRPLGRFATVVTGTFAGRSRPPVAQAFEVVEGPSRGGRFVAVANHFKSKGSCPEPPDPDADRGDGQGCWSPTRTRSAHELLAWLAGDPTGTGIRDLVVLGDFNAYTQEDPIAALAAGGLVDVASALGAAPATSIVHDGRGGALDHVFVSRSLRDAVTGIVVVPLNAAEPTVLDYRTAFKSPAQARLNVGTPYRASDHDPVVVGLAPRPGRRGDGR